MTRDEAIEILKNPSEMYAGSDGIVGYTFNPNRRNYEAFQLAIKALEQEPILDKMRDEVIAKYPKNYAGEPELNGNACEFSLNQILQIIDKYKSEMES